MSDNYFRRTYGGGQPAPVIAAPKDPLEPIRAQQISSGIQNDEARLEMERMRLAMERERAAREAEKAQKEAEATNPFNRQQLSGAATDAMNKLRTIDRITQEFNQSTLPVVGFGAETLAGFGGTGAANVQTDINTLKAGGALTEVLKMTQATGKNPFTPMSNSDVELISQNIGNLSQKAGPSTFFPNLDNYKRAYQKAYVGAVGSQALADEMDKRGLSPEQRKRAIALYEKDPRVKYALEIPSDLRPKIEREVEIYRNTPGVTPAQVRVFRDVLTQRAIEKRRNSPRSAPQSAPRKSSGDGWKIERVN